MDNKTTDWSIVLLGIVGAIALAILIVLIGGWFFSLAWNSFMVAAFVLPVITVAEGIAGMLMLYLSGMALGLRRNKSKN